MPSSIVISHPAKDIFETFTIDAALLRELGERLVGKPHVALAELVKNSYDADATDVSIVFSDDSITVTDNGRGMSRDEFVNYWLRVGTTHKQEETYSKSGRILTGSKGVGRLSVQFLGDSLEIVSQKRKEKKFKANVDWAANRESGDLVKAGALVGYVEQDYLVGGVFKFGTSVKITGLKQKWDTSELRDLARELWFLKPPEILLESLSETDRFDISVEGLPDEVAAAFTGQMNKALDNWIAIIEGKLKNGKSGGLNSIKVTFRDGDAYTADYKPSTRMLDQANFKIYVFKLTGKQAGGVGVTVARQYFKDFGGVHIYDNNFRLPFYGEKEQDWLGLEMDHSHRLNKSKLLPAEFQVQSGLNDLPTNGRIFGFTQISTSHERNTASPDDLNKGKYLNVQVTRDRLIDNAAFEELIYSVRWAIDFYAMRSYERRQIKIASSKLEIPKTDEKVSEIRQQLFQLSMRVPDALSQEVEAISGQFEELELLEQQRKSAIIRERVLLAALATTGMAAIAMEHELGKELTVLGDIKNKLSKNKGSVDDELLRSIASWADRSAKARKLFSPLMNEADRERRNKYNAQKVVARIVSNSEALLRDIQVDVSGIPKTLILPEASFAAWNAVFQNVLINAVNAMIDSNERRIYCIGEDHGPSKALYVLDSGVGVRLHDSDDLFKPFIRRLEIPEERKALGLGGMGIGLTIVKMVSDSLDCKVSFVEPLQGFSTSFKLEWTA